MNNIPNTPVFRRSETVRVIITGRTSIKLEDFELTEGEYKILTKILEWIRGAKYGSLELSVNTYKNSSTGAIERSVDVCPTGRDRIIIEPAETE